MNPFKNLQSELKNALQSAMNDLGPEFHKASTSEDPNSKTVLAWSAFGYEYAGWYHVAMYDQNTQTREWKCTGAAVISASELNWDAVNNTNIKPDDGGDPFDNPSSGTAAAIFPNAKG